MVLISLNFNKSNKILFIFIYSSKTFWLLRKKYSSKIFLFFVFFILESLTSCQLPGLKEKINKCPNIFFRMFAIISFKHSSLLLFLLLRLVSFNTTTIKKILKKGTEMTKWFFFFFTLHLALSLPGSNSLEMVCDLWMNLSPFSMSKILRSLIIKLI